LLVLFTIDLIFIVTAVSYIIIEPNHISLHHFEGLRFRTFKESYREKFSTALYDIASRGLCSRFNAWVDGCVLMHLSYVSLLSVYNQCYSYHEKLIKRKYPRIFIRVTNFQFLYLWCFIVIVSELWFLCVYMFVWYIYNDCDIPNIDMSILLPHNILQY
jgi:hypothetical protein